MTKKKTETHEKHFDEGWVEFEVEKDGRVHCTECGKILDVKSWELDGTGSGPVCKKCAGF
jgi:hypothetical protein